MRKVFIVALLPLLIGCANMRVGQIADVRDVVEEAQATIQEVQEALPLVEEAIPLLCMNRPSRCDDAEMALDALEVSLKLADKLTQDAIKYLDKGKVGDAKGLVPLIARELITVAAAVMEIQAILRD